MEPDTGIITDCALTQANGAADHEASVGLAPLEGETTPVTVLADSAYGSGEFRAELIERHHRDRVKPVPYALRFPVGSPSMTSRSTRRGAPS